MNESRNPCPFEHDFYDSFMSCEGVLYPFRSSWTNREIHVHWAWFLRFVHELRGVVLSFRSSWTNREIHVHWAWFLRFVHELRKGVLCPTNRNTAGNTNCIPPTQFQFRYIEVAMGISLEIPSRSPNLGHFTPILIMVHIDLNSNKIPNDMMKIGQKLTSPKWEYYWNF